MSRQKGYIGEEIAIKYLKNKNFNFICKNYYSKYGEIDIIFEDLQYIIFAEVKMRKKNSLVRGIESISAKKQENIIKTAYIYLEKFKKIKQPRFDVIIIEYDYKVNIKSINHIENAFGVVSQNS
ncbi:MAG: YraN family protein [Oscillospiraceae bacterium]|nr:YraN family protein [Oscillospiraceae bacterium]